MDETSKRPFANPVLRAHRSSVAVNQENRCLKGVVAALRQRLHKQEAVGRERLRQLALLREANQHLVKATFCATDMQDAAELAQDRQTTFLSMLAHELRNPIASIAVANTVMGSLEAGSPRFRRLIDIVGRQSSFMVRLVDDLLDVSRIRTGKLSLKFGEVRLADVVDAAIATADSVIGQRLQRVQVELPATGVTLHADHQRLVQLFANLLVNASKFSPPAATLRVSALVLALQVAVTVSDPGKGIAAQDMERMFELFEQGPGEAGHTLSGGLGIGLSLVRAIAELHGGSVSVASGGAGQGSAFTVTLPLVTTSAARTPDGEICSG